MANEILETHLFAGIPMRFRSGTRDWYTLRHVMDENIYQVPNDLDGQWVVDVGAHIGGFSALAALRGAKGFAFEPQTDNFNLLRENLKRFPLEAGRTCIQIDRSAVLDYGKPCQPLYYHADNTGMHSLRSDINGFTLESPFELVKITSIEHVLDLIPSCSILKLDCEGSEEKILPIVFSKYVSKVRVIAVEFHTRAGRTRLLEKSKTSYNEEKLSDWEWRLVRK